MAIHPTAIIDPSAEIDESCEIGPNVRIMRNCKIGPENTFMDGAIIGPNTVVGSGNVFHFHCVVGHDPQYLGFDPATESGTVIGDGNQFREFCQIHRGLKSGGNTLIGDGNFFMATSHAAHDCIVGNHNVLANYAGLAGHVTVGDRVFISTLVGIHQFCRVGSVGMIGGFAGVSKDTPPYCMVKGYGIVRGLNTVGLKRAGVGPESRKALRAAFRELFRKGRPLNAAIETVREEWRGKEMPAELEHFLTFCGERSKRGLLRGLRANETGFEDDAG